MEVSNEEWEKIQLRLDKLKVLENLGVDNTPIIIPHLSAWNRKWSILCLKEDFVGEMQQLIAEENQWEFPAGREAGISVYFTTRGEQMIKTLFDEFHQKRNKVEKETNE